MHPSQVAKKSNPGRDYASELVSFTTVGVRMLALIERRDGQLSLSIYWRALRGAPLLWRQISGCQSDVEFALSAARCLFLCRRSRCLGLDQAKPVHRSGVPSGIVGAYYSDGGFRKLKRLRK